MDDQLRELLMAMSTLPLTLILTKASTPVLERTFIFCSNGICILTLQCVCQTLDASWEVDLGQSTVVKRVNIIQRPFATPPHAKYASRLSNSIVSLLDHGDNIIATYRIGDTSQLQSIDISYTDFRSNYGASAYSVCRYPMQKVKVIARVGSHVSFNELEVFDNSDSNVALGKPATQISTHQGHIAAKAVNGIYDDFTHTGDDHVGSKYWSKHPRTNLFQICLIHQCVHLCFLFF